MPKIPEVTIYANNKWSDIKPLSDFDKIVQIPWTKYIKEIHNKKQIVIHHTVSGDGITGDLSTWEQWRTVSVCMIIDRNGIINQLFSSKYWASHLKARNENLDKSSIGVELDNWGGLIKGDGTLKQFGKRRDGSPNMIKTEIEKFYAIYGNIVDCPITYYKDGFRGYEYFETYSDIQLRSLGELLGLWNQRYKIPLTYHPDMWQKSPSALLGEPGIWGHVSYRNPKDKQDPHPQPELISMLKTLSTLNF